MAYFNANLPFLRKIWLFTSLKVEEYHFILPSQYKYDFLDGYPMGLAGINMFSISKMSKINPRGGSAIFKNVWNSKMSELSEGGGGQA